MGVICFLLGFYLIKIYCTGQLYNLASSFNFDTVLLTYYSIMASYLIKFTVYDNFILDKMLYF